MSVRRKYLESYMTLLPRKFWPEIKTRLAYKNVLESGESLKIPPRVWAAYLTPPDPTIEKYIPRKFKPIWQLKIGMLKTFDSPALFLRTRNSLHTSCDVATLVLLEILFDLNEQKVLLTESKYRKWLEDANHFGLWKLRYMLEDAIFKAFNPENFSLFESVIKKQMFIDKHLVTAIRSILEDALARASITKFTIENRTKNIYGVYKKIALKRKSINDIYDIHGFRILVTTTEECYRAVDVLHQLWPRFPERFKDYISNPKENGYQSIHTVLSCLEKKPIEFQVRTYEMDSVAASGPANHADYKDKKCKVTLSELF